MNTQIIAIANQKGGVGKTTTCANLGIGLAQTGKKVLLIDGDPQGSLTISLGHPQPDKLPFTLSDAMGRILMDEPLKPGEGILHHPEGVDLMPADIQLSGMEVSLVNAMSRETILRQYLDTLKGQYSHILIDCQPSLGMLTVNALAAANRVIIPVQAEYLPAKGLEQLLQTVNKVKRQINPKLQIDGIMDLAIIAALMIILEGAGSIYISFLLVPLEVASMLITLANSDEQWKWGKYAVALPISKRQIVSSRYAFGGIAAIIGLCVALVVNTISYFCFPAYQFGFYLFLSIASFCMVLLFLAFILPSNYWLGVNAGFAVMFILIILLVVLGIWSRMTNNAIMGFVVDNFDLSMAIGFVSTIVIFALSYILSVGLFKRKYS